MPTLRTRNTTRAGSQKDAANSTSTSNNKSRIRRRTQDENSTQDNDKENAGCQGRTTRLHTGPGVRTGASTNNAAVLGSGQATARKGAVKGENATISKLKTASKGKGVPSSAPVLRNKLPLQDITSQFLPAPEAANRGEDAQAPSEDVVNNENADLETKETTNIVVARMPPPEPTAVPLPASSKFAVTSPLPPSSPPSDHELAISPAPFRRMTSASNIFDVKVRFPSSSAAAIPEEIDDLWQEYDDNAPLTSELIDGAKAAKLGSDADPFGFKSLQMKLKAQLKEAALTSDQDYEDEDYALLLPVADTSSPRPVSRLKRSLQFEDDDVPEPSPEEKNDDDNLHLHPHYTTPCTPQKDRDSPKRRKMTPHAEDQDVFGPWSSSVLEPSPSPCMRLASAPQTE